MYLLLLLIGLIGYVAMMTMGFSHTGGHGGHSLHSGSHSHGHSPPIKIGGSHPITHGHHDGALRSVRDLQPWFFLSPIAIFSMSMGAGLTGVLLQSHLAPLLTGLCAAAGALGFQLLLVKPITNAVLKFASRPSDGLEGAIAQPVEALTAFDQSGKGLVRITLDGQIVHLLANLEPSEMSSGVKVMRGDRLMVTQVNPTKNSCHVTKEIS